MFSRQQLLETAKASPEAVAKHDRKAWLALFSHDAEVHDPVGSRGHPAGPALERFYDTFIAPNRIHFRVDHDIVCGQSVVRDLVIETHMGGTRLQVDTPLFIRYEIVEERGQPRVRRLYAHWELLPMLTGQVFGAGLGTGLFAMMRLSANMLGHQGVGGVLGFMRALRGVGTTAKSTSAAWLSALAAGDTDAASERLAPGCPLILGTETTTLGELASQLTGLRWEKMLAGGRQVTARLLWGDQRAVALFDFDLGQKLIRSVRIYCESP